MLRRGLNTMKKPRSQYCSHIHFDSPPIPHPILGRITPTPSEQDLIHVLKETCRCFSLQTVPRIAGGWVRDKLLQGDSHDVDVALNDCSGEYFAGKVNEYLQSHGEKTHSVGVIKANPEQSKHLATATLKVVGKEIDFVNLRSEMYDNQSRIPIITNGTPLEDALRRDFTVNSMFYQALTGTVEDLTGMGLEDLENGVLRTPLPAMITFRDDPLRMLRAVRFAARYGFALDDELCCALGNEENALALGSKVSNERVGIEMDKSLRGKRPRLALELVVRHGLADAVFKVPEERYDGEVVSSVRMDWFTGLRIVEGLASRMPEDAGRSDAPALWVSAMLFPLGLMECAIPGKKGKREPVVKQIVANSLKWSRVSCEQVYSIVFSATKLAEFLVRKEVPREDRLKLGRLLFEVKESWKDGLNLALAVLCAGRMYSKDELEYVALVEERSRELVQRIERDWALDKVWERLEHDPILDGKQLMTMLQIKGPQVTRAVNLVRDFAFENNQKEEETRDGYVARAESFVKEMFAKDEVENATSAPSSPKGAAKGAASKKPKGTPPVAKGSAT